jgi:Ca2+-binding RTX toxin-like protein
MPRTRALSLAVIAAGLLTFAPSANATITVSSSGDTVFVTGDGNVQPIHLRDGDLADAQPYAFAFYSDNAGEQYLEDGDSTCVADSGGVVTVYCGNASVTKAVFNLGGGNDTFESYGDPIFDVLSSLTLDLGAGSDDNGSGVKGIPTVIRGGDGDDTLAGQDGPTSVVEGGPGADQIVGGGGLSGETLGGGDGDDQIQGLNGNDQIFGDGGNDTLVGSAGGDTITGGPGLDNVEGDGVPNAFSGNDTLQLQDGERDSAACGFGADTVVADSFDLLPLQDCESVTLAGAPAGGTPPPPVATPTGDAKVALAKPSKLSARKRRIAVEVSCPSDANGGCQGQVRFTVKFTERGKKRSLSLGRVSFTLQPGTSKTVGRKLSKKIVRRLRKAKKRKLTVRAISRDAAFKEYASRKTATLKIGR